MVSCVAFSADTVGKDPECRQRPSSTYGCCCTQRVNHIHLHKQNKNLRVRIPFR